MEVLDKVDRKEIIRKSLENSISFEKYFEVLQSYAREGKTTGPIQKEDLIEYTKLNAQRGKRVAKTLVLDELLNEKIKSIRSKQTWLAISESWCGDAANSLPVLSKLSEQNVNIDFKIVLRDSNLELMDQFQTNGSRSIPKLIVLNDKDEILFTLGPRPQKAQKIYDDWRSKKNRIPYKEFHIELQKWYNQDRGQSLQKEILTLIALVDKH